MSGSYYGVGIYLEHYSYNTFFTTSSFAAPSSASTWIEDPVWSSRRRRTSRRSRTGRSTPPAILFPGNQAGVYLQPGTEATTVQGVIFKNQNWAAIGADSTTGTNSFSANDFTGLKTGAAGLRTTPLNG